MVCQWCSTISEAVGRLHPGETRIEPSRFLSFPAQDDTRFRPRDMETNWNSSYFASILFSAVKSDRDSGGSDASHGQVQHSLPQYLYRYLLSIILEVGFRLARTNPTWSSIYLDDTYRERIFETAFSSDDDEVIADAVGMWIMSSGPTPLGLFARHLTKRLKRDRPLSQGLRQLIIRAFNRAWCEGSWESGPETVHLLNCLDANLDEFQVCYRVDLLSCVVGGPGGLKLSPHYWHLLDRSVVEGGYLSHLKSSDWGTMRALWEAEDWEKLEVWMLAMWKSLEYQRSRPESTEDIQQVTLDLLSRRPSALRRFRNICGEESNDGQEESNDTEEESNYTEEESNYDPKRVLRDICKRARAEIENLPSEDSPGLPYVSLQPAGIYLF